MIETVVAFFAGLLIGSFLNVCIYRLPRDLSLVRPRSFCPECEKGIAWFDNVPLLSYLILRGRCRHCKQGIPLRYPIVELLMGLSFGAAVLSFGVTPAAAKFCVFAAIIMTLIWSDLEERILPDEFTLGGIVIGLVSAALAPLEGGLAYVFVSGASLGRLGHSVLESAIGAVFTGGALWLVGELYWRIRHREGLGLGDVKMVAMIGAFLGLQGALLTLIVGAVTGSVIGLGYILLTGKDSSTYELPFGTFLGAAALVVAFWGQWMLKWYQGSGA